MIKKEINTFKSSLKFNECNSIALEFFTRKKPTWPFSFQTENIAWEVWTIKFDLMQLSNENGKLLYF